MRELLRRFVPLLLLFAGVALAFWSPSSVTEIRPLTPEEELKPGGRVFSLEIEEEAALSEALSSGVIVDDVSYLSTQKVSFLAAPLKEHSLLRGVFRGGEKLLDVRIHPSWDMKGLPGEVRFPFRRWLWIAPLLALAVYIFLPRAPAVPGAFRYIRSRSVLVPDFLAFFLALFFWGLPFLLSSAHGWGYPLGGENIFAPLMFWIPGSLALLLLFLTARYGALQIASEEGGLRWRTLTGWKFLPYGEMKTVTLKREKPKKLSALMRLASLFPGGWRLVGPTIAMEGNTGRALTLAMRDGKKYSLWIDYLEEEGGTRLPALIAEGRKKGKV